MGTTAMRMAKVTSLYKTALLRQQTDCYRARAKLRAEHERLARTAAYPLAEPSCLRRRDLTYRVGI